MVLGAVAGHYQPYPGLLAGRLGAYPAVYSGNLGIGHRGGIRGYESSMFYFPRTGVSVVLLSNQGNWAMDEPMGRLVKTVLGVK